MKCPNCESMKLATIESRNRNQRPYVYRVRKCLDCGQRFVTHEIIYEDKADPYKDAINAIMEICKNIGDNDDR